jgi:hypothetical protein
MKAPQLPEPRRADCEIYDYLVQDGMTDIRELQDRVNVKIQDPKEAFKSAFEQFYNDIIFTIKNQ